MTFISGENAWALVGYLQLREVPHPIMLTTIDSLHHASDALCPMHRDVWISEADAGSPLGKVQHVLTEHVTVQWSPSTSRGLKLVV